MNRRKFIAHTSASSVFVGLGGLALGSCISESAKKITILHTNDMHSHIDPFSADHSEYANLGGMARRASLIARIRKENQNTLLFDAGDIFQGTPYFNFYGGELEFKLMSMLKYDAATIGNHDFDNGIEGLFAQLPHAQFELLSANYDFSNTIMDHHVKPYKTFIVDGIKIGVYGIGIKLSGLVGKNLYKETEYLDPYGIAQDTERLLKEEEGCHLVICLSHIGYDYSSEDRPNDLVMATKTQYTDLIIGGHTHTFLNEPTLVENSKGREIIVNQVGCFGLYLGRIDFYLDSNKHIGANGVSIKV